MVTEKDNFELTATQHVGSHDQGSNDNHQASTHVRQSSHGHGHPLERYINLSSVLNFGLIILASWESVAVTFQFSLLNGGPASMVYGSIVAGFGASAIALSLAEMASIDPTVGAQYRWSANLAPSHPRFWGLIQGWMTVSAWIFACAGPPTLISNMITALAIFNHESYRPERWHMTMIMWAVMLFPLISNLWFRKILNALELAGGAIHVVLFIITMAILIALGKRSTPEFVFKTVTHDLSGWENPGIAFGLGLLTCTFSIAGFDSVIHMSDEVKKVRTRIPRSLWVAVVSNAIMMFGFIICLLFSLGDAADVASISSSPTGLPIIEVYYQATGSKAVTNILVAFLAIICFFALFNMFASVSRLVWVFALDNGLPFSSFFAYVHPTLKLPVNALGLIGTIVFLLAIIYIASATAFNALISLQTLALHVSYFIPILFMAIRKVRGPPPPYGPFKLGRIGLATNVFALAYLIFVILWMPWPSVLPVTGSTMNYAGPLVGFVILAALVDWMFGGRKRFEVPVARYKV
ncbi:amino acid transporter [Glonium stellatum]|uniref:Amino acid transporter n=1 Tax=Glonium stellatum TaxID=574774 RepID=A0A8E2F2N1_9PEZI|nr:amino acid transporter [Glonium stellatum]